MLGYTFSRYLTLSLTCILKNKKKERNNNNNKKHSYHWDLSLTEGGYTVSSLSYHQPGSQFLDRVPQPRLVSTNNTPQLALWSFSPGTPLPQHQSHYKATQCINVPKASQSATAEASQGMFNSVEADGCILRVSVL